MTHEDSVRTYYDRRVDAEWARLDASWLEHGTTRHFIDKFVGPESTILDVGGGPGRYALDLAAAGHDVALVDLSPNNIAFALKIAGRRAIRLCGARVADARDLSVFPDASFDTVLNLGPLYHLLEEDDRAAAVRESLRVLKPGGHVFFAYLSCYAPIYFNLKTGPEDVGLWRGVVERVLELGIHTADADDRFFADSHFIEPDEIEPFMDRFAVERQILFGTEGVMAQNEAMLRALPGAIRREWQELAIETAATPAALDASEHLVYVGGKPVATGNTTSSPSAL